MGKTKAKREYPLDGKTTFGLSTMRWTIMAAMSLTTTVFLLYLTDYSGIGAAAATVGTILLLAGRLFDAFDDPLQGWLMDNAPCTKIGRYKPFMLGGIVVCTAALILLFNIPRGVSLAVKIVWLSVAYLLYEIGYSFQPADPIKYSLSPDPKIRERILVVPRVVEQIIAVPFSFFLALALALGGSLGDAGKGISLSVILVTVPMMIMSFVGTLLVREGHVMQQSESVGFRDILAMLKINKPLLVMAITGLIGLTFPFIMASAVYYIKWAFGPENLGTNSAIWGAVILLGIITGTIIAPKLLKGTIPMKGVIICSLANAVPLVVLYVLSILGFRNPIVFFGFMFLAMTAAGMSYIPGTVLAMEVMDYSLHRTGKGMQGIIQAIRNFLEKTQSAMSSTVTGAVLIAVGYVVNDAGDYVGTAPVESLLFGLLLVCMLIPAILSVLSAGIYHFFYPLKGAVRDQMYAQLGEFREQSLPESA